MISFARGVPTPDALPVEELADCARSVLERDGRTILSYGPSPGYGPLREWLAERHGVDVGRVFVTNGSLQGFVFLAQRLAPGKRVLVERPTYDRPLKILRELGATVEGLDCDDDGLDPDALERALEHSLLVLEDDPYGLCRYDGEPLPSLFELSGGGVAYSSSFSKTIAPGIRVGWFVLPEETAREVEATATATYITPVLLGQATVYEFLARGNFEPNLERVNGLLRARRDAMIEALDRELPGRRHSQPEGGYFVWLELDGV